MKRSSTVPGPESDDFLPLLMEPCSCSIWNSLRSFGEGSCAKSGDHTGDGEPCATPMLYPGVAIVGTVQPASRAWGFCAVLLVLLTFLLLSRVPDVPSLLSTVCERNRPPLSCGDGAAKVAKSSGGKPGLGSPLGMTAMDRRSDDSKSD